MSDQEPVCAYVAETNSDAHLIATFLNDHGIKAHAIEDNSPAGMFALGTLPEIYRPKVLVDPASLDAAVEIISRYEKGKLQAVSPGVFCYHCGAECQSAAEECESCGKALDLDAAEEIDTAERKSHDENSPLADFRSIKKPFAFALLLPYIFIGVVILYAVISQLFGL